MTSAAGLAVAIPAYILYSYLAAALQTLLHDMERGGIEIVQLLTATRESREVVDFKESAQRLVEDQKKRKLGSK